MNEAFKPKLPTLEAIPNALREKTDAFIRDVSTLHTFHQVIWRLEQEKAFQEFTPSWEKQPYKDAKLLGDSGEEVSVNDLIDDMKRVEMYEEKPENLEPFVRYVQKMKSFSNKVSEMTTARMQLNEMFAKEWKSTVTPDGDPFIIGAIDRAKVDSKTLAPADANMRITIAPGYSVAPKVMRRNIPILASEGCSAMTFSVPPKSEKFDASLTFPKGTPTITKVHTTALLRTLEVADKEIFEAPAQNNVISYSFGAISTLMAAANNPEKIPNIILLNPAGLTERNLPKLLRFTVLANNSRKHGSQVLEEAGEYPRKLLGRWSPTWIRHALSTIGTMEDVDELASHLFGEFSKSMNEVATEAGKMEGIRTAWGIASANLLPLIEQVTAKGVKVKILFSEGDPLFDEAQIEQAGNEAGIDAYQLAGGHANVGFSPGGTSELCIDAFRRMNEERAEEKGGVEVA